MALQRVAVKSLRRRCHGRYGKGRHSAGLNFGDCFSYSLAKVKGEPLPFKGEDFSTHGYCRGSLAGWIGVSDFRTVRET